MPRSRERDQAPPLSDQRRLRIVLIALAVTLILTNATAYLVGRTFAAGSNARTDQRIATLEADLAERRATRLEMDAEQQKRDQARQAADAQLRKDACIAFDRLQPRDQAVLDLRKRYGCTGNPRPAAAPGPTPGQPSNGSGPSGQRPADNNVPDGQGRPAPPPQAPPPAGPQGPPGPVGPPGPAAPPEDDGLICLPIVGCLL